tara:strand:- start:196 stop:1116 length:921 start_codon:yes stop_codon:yes gene_type:complete
MINILCFRNSRLGDFLISVPTLKLIRNQNKNCKIYYLSDRSEIYKSLPKYLGKEKIVDQFIFYENNFFSIIKLFFLLKTFNFKTFYYLQEKSSFYRELRDYIFFSILNFDKKYGFFKKKRNYKKFNETLQIIYRTNENISKNEIYDLLKIKLKKDKPHFNFKYITISIGGFSQPKLWRIDYWTILLKLILSNFDYKIIILGTSKDKKNANLLCSINNKKIMSLCGKTNLDELLNLIKFSKTHITNDNGSMHAATLFQKKTICLFNNHDSIGKWHPLNKNAIILRNNNGINFIKPTKVFIKLQKILF